MNKSLILLFDSSSPTLKIGLKIGSELYEYSEMFDRTLAHFLLNFLQQKLALHRADFTDITAIGVFEGPGSFTGIRIGLAVLNTLADAENIPIVGARGEKWREQCLQKIANQENQRIILPFYSSDAHITQPRK